MTTKKMRFCPFLEKPCRDDCMHYEAVCGPHGSGNCLRDTGRLLEREFCEAMHDLCDNLGGIARAIIAGRKP